MKPNCECITGFNKELEKYNTKLSLCLFINGDVVPYVATEKITSRQKGSAKLGNNIFDSVGFFDLRSALCLQSPKKSAEFSGINSPFPSNSLPDGIYAKNTANQGGTIC